MDLGKFCRGTTEKSFAPAGLETGRPGGTAAHTCADEDHSQGIIFLRRWWGLDTAVSSPPHHNRHNHRQRYQQRGEL